MSNFTKGPENESAGKYFWSNGTPTQPAETDDLSLRRMPHSPEDAPPLAKYRRVEINPIFLNSDVVRMEERVFSEQPILGGSPAQEPGPTSLRLIEPNAQLSSSGMVVDNRSDVNVAADSGFGAQMETTDLNRSRMPHNPSSVEMLHDSDVNSSDSHMNGQLIPGGPSQEPGPKFLGLIEPNPQLSSSGIVIDDSAGVLGSSEGQMNVQPIPGGSQAQEPGSTILGLIEPNPQLSSSGIVIDDGAGVQGFSEGHLNEQPIPGGSPAQEPGPSTLSLNEPNLKPSNNVIVIDDSSDEDVSADSDFGAEITTADLSLSRMPHSPRVEINPSSSVEMVLYSDINRLGVQDSSDSHMNGQPLPGGSPAQEPGPTILGLIEPNPQHSSSRIVIDDGAGVQGFSEGHLNEQPIPGGSPAQEPGPSTLSLNEPNLKPSNNVIVIDDSSDENEAANSPISSSVRHIQENSTHRYTTSQKGNLPPQKLQDILSCQTDDSEGVQGSSESHMNGQPIPGGSPAQEPGPTSLGLIEPDPQLLSSGIVIDDRSDVNVAPDSGFEAQMETTDLNRSGMPHNPSSVEMLHDSDVNLLGVQDSSDSHMNGQPIPGGSPAQEPGPTILGLIEPNPQHSSSGIVIADSAGVQGSSEGHMNLQPIPGGSSAQEPGPSTLSWNKPNLKPSNNVIVIDDSSDENEAANSPISFLVRHIQGNSTPRYTTSQKGNLPPLKLQDILSLQTKSYFFERLGFSKSEFLKDTFVDKLKKKFAREREESNIKRRHLMQIIEETRSKRKAHDRAMLEKIYQFQFAKCPIYLVESVHVEELMPLTRDHLQQYDNLVHGPPFELIHQHINRSDILTLVGMNCLNDKVINFYMNLLMERSEQRQGELPSVYAMNTFFLQRLDQSGYEGVSRWTRKVDLFSKDIIPVPVHSAGDHWCMAIIHLRNKTIRFYDSMRQPNEYVLDTLESYLKQESLHKRQEPFDTSDFKIESVPNVPRQRNNYDCGVFACMYAEYITRDATFNFTQTTMPYFRKRMILEILDGKLWN